jgi:hypothetical protein
MWYTIALNIILSIIIIFIAHQLWEYCKLNYTTPKIKDLVEVQASKYKQMVEDLERNTTAVIPVASSQPTYTPVLVKLQHSDFLPLEEKEWVQKELSSFIDTL